MKRFRLNGLTSDIIISIYVVITLYFRFKLESKTATGPIESVVMGICFLVIIWALIKLKVLNPNWFGLFNTKTSKPWPIKIFIKKVFQISRSFDCDTFLPPLDPSVFDDVTAEVAEEEGIPTDVQKEGDVEYVYKVYQKKWMKVIPWNKWRLSREMKRLSLERNEGFCMKWKGYHLREMKVIMWNKWRLSRETNMKSQKNIAQSFFYNL